MKMAINVYEYGRGGKCVYIFRYIYAGNRIVKPLSIFQIRGRPFLYTMNISPVYLEPFETPRNELRELSADIDIW